MSKLVFIKDYNNYYNRIIKRESYSYITEYYTYDEVTAVNFNPNDDLSTEQIIN